MYRGVVALLIFVSVLIHANSTLGERIGYNCSAHYDKYRQIRYWAKKQIWISDYQFGSGDAKFLNLVRDAPDSSVATVEEEIVGHFDSEFERHIRQELPYHDIDQGRQDRLMKSLRESVRKDNFLEVFEAQEEARMRSLYGPNPGAANCQFRIERREFPILYEAECRITTNMGFVSFGGLEKSKLGYSSPEHIVGELKYAISTLLERLGNDMHAMKTC